MKQFTPSTANYALPSHVRFGRVQTSVEPQSIDMSRGAPFIDAAQQERQQREAMIAEFNAGDTDATLQAPFASQWPLTGHTQDSDQPRRVSVLISTRQPHSREK